jgi:protein ImuB
VEPDLAAAGSAPVLPRVLALWIPDLPLQRVRRGRDRGEGPLAVVHEGRVVCCDPAARAQGVRPGDSAVQAEAACAGLEISPLDPAADEAALGALAEALQALAPAAELAPPDGLLLDASAAHLLLPPSAPPGEDAEALLLARAVALAAEMGYRCRAALASGKAPARALARHGRGRGAPVPPGATAEALAPLPLAALPGIPPDVAARLAGLGIADVGSLSRLPPETLAHRFGRLADALVRLARGEDPSPLAPHEPRRLPEEAIELEAPAESAEPLLFAAKRLADRVAARLAGRGLGATRLELALRLDPRALRPGSGRDEVRLEVPLARPSAAASRWLLVLRERVFALRLDAPVAGVALAVGEAAPALPEQLALGDRPEELRALETVLSRLAARLGDRALFAAEPQERHRPEAAYAPGPFRGGRNGKGRKAPTPTSDPWTDHPERREARRAERSRRTPDDEDPASPPLAGLVRPTRLLPAPLPLVALGEGGRIAAVRCRGRIHRVLSLSRPERLAGEWWSEPFDRDYHRALLEDLGECWIYRDGSDGRLWLHGFFD